MDSYIKMAKHLDPNWKGGPRTEDGMFYFCVPHATISDSTTQTIADAAVAQAITFDTNDELDGIAHSTTTNPSRIYAETAGHYMVFISVICDLATGTNQQLDIWFRLDGADIARSNTTIILSGTAKQILAVQIDIPMTAGQYFEVMMAGGNTAVRIEATAAQVTPTRPASPSIILTAFRTCE